MKSSLTLLLSLAATAQVLAATEVLHLNQTTVMLTDANPPINATAFVNLAPFEVSVYTTLPYEFSSLRNLTNYGQMLGEPGFLFQYRTNSSAPPQPLSCFDNVGIISVSSQMAIYASNVVGGLLLECGDQGYIKITATNTTDHVDLSGTGLQAGPNPLLAGLSYGLFLDQAGTQYINDIGVSDSFWASGINGRLPGTAGQNQYSPSSLASYFSGAGLFFGLTNTPSTPFFPYQYITSAGGTPVTMSGSTSLPQCGGAFAAYDTVTSLRPANSPRNAAYTEFRQIVYVATNLDDLDVQVEIISAPGQNIWESIVQFGLTDTNIVDGTPYTSYLTLYDTALTAVNGAYAQQQAPPFPSATPAVGTVRPSNYQLTRAPYFPTGFFFGAVPGTNGFDYNFLYPSNTMAGNVDLYFSAYGAGLWQYYTNSVQSNPNPAVTDPTNHPGRIQLFANAINLDQARIRAENFVGLEAHNLFGNPAAVLPQIDAPFVNFDLGSTNPVIVVSNTLPATVRRFYGQLAAYSAVWSVIHTNANAFETNAVTTRYHVLLVDNCLAPQPVSLHKFAVHGTAVDLEDPLSVQGDILLDASDLTVGPNGGLALPAGWSWGYTNVPRLHSLTNDSTISVPRDANFQITNVVRVSIPTNILGRLTNYFVTNVVTGPYENIVNHGVITAETFSLWSRYFEQTATPSFPNVIQAGLGPISLDTLTTFLDGAQLLASSKLTLFASNMTVNQSLLWAGTNSLAGGSIEISVTNRLTDGVTNAAAQGISNAVNQWVVGQGISVDRLPTGERSLLGTVIYSKPAIANATHCWPGRDLGRTAAGFSNNLALGKLILDASATTSFTFQGPDSTNQYALYVDFLDLRGWVTNNGNFLSALKFPSTNFTIYFADSTVSPQTLNNSFFSRGGRLKWVYSYAGLFSSTNVSYVVTNAYGVASNTYTLNRSLAQLYANGGGPANIDSSQTIFTPLDVALDVSQIPGVPAKSVLSWWALAGSTNQIEFATNLAAPQWSLLTNSLFVNGTNTVRVSFTNSGGGSFRVYRVREDPRSLLP